MASARTKHGSYREYQSGLSAAMTGTPQAPRLAPHGLTLLYGTSEFLLGDGAARLRQAALNTGAVVSPVETATLTESSLPALCCQVSLFEPTTFYLLRRAEAARNLARLLKGLTSGKALTNHVCFVYSGEGPAAPIKKELVRLQTRLVPCFSPWPNEVPAVILDIAARLGLKLRQDAVQLLGEALGDDLVKQHNELRRLALAFSQDERTQPLTAAQLAPHLGMLREDDAFQLDRLLLTKDWAKAHALTSDLLDRGEKGIALLAILASHCRNTIRISDALASGRPMDQVGGLPPFVVKTYAQHLRGGTRIDARRYGQALQLCQSTDMALKCSSLDEGLLLSAVIEVLASPV